MCRNILEELGLISWREETACVHIQSYSEWSEKDALGKLSIPEQASLLIGAKTPINDVEVRLPASKMSRAIFSFLM